jgi:hypothetical protein
MGEKLVKSDRPTVQIISTGKIPENYRTTINNLRTKIESYGVRFEDVRRYEQDAIATIILSVIGGVGVELIKLLIEEFTKPKTEPKIEVNVNVSIVDQSTNITFRLPSEKTAATEHFTRQQEPRSGREKKRKL